MPQKKRAAYVRVLLLCTAVLLCCVLKSSITDAPNRSDARQNLQAAWNLYAWGVFSKSTATDTRPAPDNYREPFPVFVTSAYLFLLGKDRVCENGDCAGRGFNNRTIKAINLLWSFAVLCLSSALACRITRSWRWALIVQIFVWACFLRDPAHIDRLYTEVPASACMLACALCCAVFVRKPSLWISFAAGASLGLLMLTKAVFLYAGPLLVAGAMCAVLVRRSLLPAGYYRKSIGLLCAGLLITAGPWLIRNAVHFGSFNISSRGGLALYTRALINQMDAFEYRAAFFYWGPGAYRRIVRGTPLAVDAQDFERGGRAERLNCSEDASFAGDDFIVQKQGRPEDAVSFYAIARARRVAMQRDLHQAGCRNTAQAADRHVRDEAAAMIIRHPVGHVAATLPVAWRGMWCFYGGGLWTVLGAAAYAAFVCMCLYAAAWKKGELCAFLVTPFFLLAFNAFLTNNLPRFNTPAIPFMAISLAVALQLLCQRICRGRVRQEKNSDN